jgi:hypothetical protein
MSGAAPSEVAAHVFLGETTDPSISNPTGTMWSAALKFGPPMASELVVLSSCGEKWAIPCLAIIGHSPAQSAQRRAFVGIIDGSEAFLF